jgi:pyridoxal phosphate enzyme (YggS family)
MDKEATIFKNLSEIKSKLNKETLVAVSKNVTAQEIRLATKAGQLDFGENRVQDLVEKSEKLADLPIRWHFIGTLQKNKVKKLLQVKNLYFIHSVDSLSLIDELIKNKELPLRPIGLFLQCNTSGETEKHGFENLDELKIAAFKIKKDGGPNFYLKGIMTIGKIRSSDFQKDAQISFSALKKLKKELEKEKFEISLSMGMSQDFEIALREGTDYLRIGSAIFNP